MACARVQGLCCVLSLQRAPGDRALCHPSSSSRLLPLHSQQTCYYGRGICFFAYCPFPMLKVPTFCERRPTACGHPAMLRAAARVALVDFLRFAEEDTRKQLCGARVSRVQGIKASTPRVS